MGDWVLFASFRQRGFVKDLMHVQAGKAQRAYAARVQLISSTAKRLSYEHKETIVVGDNATPALTKLNLPMCMYPIMYMTDVY